MKGPDPKTSSGFSDVESAISLGPINREPLASEQTTQQGFREPATYAQAFAHLRLLWESRRFLGGVAVAGLLLSTLIALLIPSRYQSVARLMPPDNQSSSALAMGSAVLSGATAQRGKTAEILGLRSSSDLLAGVLNSRTVQDKLIQKFDLSKAYGVRGMEGARTELAARTDISIDRKSQIITINVTDRSPRRAAAMAQAYIDELSRTLDEVSTSEGRRERLFLAGVLRNMNQHLEAAERNLANM